MDWKVFRIQGFNISHPYIAVTPGCPTERHPTRACKCKVFTNTKAAQAYIDSQQ